MRLGLVALGLLAGLLTVVALEMALRLLGIGGGVPRYDPFAGFSRTVPMFEPVTLADGTPGFRTAAARRLKVPQEFPASKPPGSFRVFVVGESSAAGVPYSVWYAFSTFLEQRLRAQLPELQVQVVNAAVSGYASRRILAVVEELARYQPDLLIVYAGHNELGERRYYAHLVEMDPRLFRLWEWLAQTRLYAVASQMPIIGVKHEPPRFDFRDLENSFQMFAVLSRNALGAYPTAREVAWGEEHYRLNVEKMVEAMQAVGVPVMLVTLGQDFADWAPGVSVHRPDLTEQDRRAFDDLVAQGDRLAPTDCPGAIAAYRRALLVDDAYADLHYRIATCERRSGKFAAARDAYRRASDLDRVPHGAPSSYNDVLRDIARRYGTMLADADRMFEQASPDGLVGQSLFVDFVHPNVHGHVLLARFLAEEMRRAGLPVPGDRWRDGYVDPEPADLYARDPGLRTQELIGRASACLLARRPACAQEATDAVLALDPGNPHGRQLAAGIKKWNEQVAQRRRVP
ncbi:MAG: SGNH/GDSL hydrolase family protein [Thermodesulfobacteriota bacterium]